MPTVTSAPDLFEWWRNYSVRQIVAGLDQAQMAGDFYWNANVALAKASGMLLPPVTAAKAEEKSAPVSPEQEVGLFHLIE